MNLKKQLNNYGKNKTPILFTISYDMKSWDIFELNNVPNDILYCINQEPYSPHNIEINIQKPNFPTYEKQFNSVINNIKKGNTYVLNLCTQSKITNKISLKNIYNNCNAKYKFYYKNKFISFSPETFIKINNNKIFTYPMKGTIDASINNSKKILMDNKKELAEHTMIVDLLRNDLSVISKDVTVEEFRYCQKIKAGIDRELYQTSSKISGLLGENWHNELGNIITSLLPAGSISGAPKLSTKKIIQYTENFNRDFFTGIWGVYDGVSLDSAVLIRYIQNNNENYVYKSGGGITIDSTCLSEYDELLQKVYIP